MAQIVSANYRNRQSPYRWLIRDEDEPLEKARACKSLVATNFTFQQSSPEEDGFGCRVVARCETAVGSDFERRAKVRFDGRKFVDEDGSVVEQGSELILDEEGGIEVIA